MRLIDADALRKNAQHAKDISKWDGELLVVGLGHILNAPTIESPRWTPCSVALPEDQSDVLIYFDRCGGEIGIGYYAERADGVKFWRAMGSMLCYNVLAWQPLPEPYRGEA